MKRTQLKEIRESKNLTQAMVVDLLEKQKNISITNAYFSQIESGKREGKLYVLFAIAEILDTDFQGIFYPYQNDHTLMEA